MDKTADTRIVTLRGWREALMREAAVSAETRQESFRVIERYLLAAEQHGWAVGVESMKSYIDMAEAALAPDTRWEVGRAALRWLVGYLRVVPAVGDWRARFERRLRELQ